MLCGHLNGKEIQKRGYLYTYNCFTLLYGRNEHSTIKQLYSKKINLKNKDDFIPPSRYANNSLFML